MLRRLPILKTENTHNRQIHRYIDTQTHMGSYRVRPGLNIRDMAQVHASSLLTQKVDYCPPRAY